MTIKEFLQWVIEHKIMLHYIVLWLRQEHFFLVSYRLSSLILFQKIVPRVIKSFLMQDMKNKENNMKKDWMRKEGEGKKINARRKKNSVLVKNHVLYLKIQRLFQIHILKIYFSVWNL